VSNASPQNEFNFEDTSPQDGLKSWRTQRNRASRRLANRLGLPLDHEVEVWLTNGVMLRGKLELKESVLFLEDVETKELDLIIGRADFRHTDIESCVRMD